MRDKFVAEAYDVDDTALVLAARRGDRHAFGLLFARHQSLLLALCRRLLRDQWLAEDATQEAAVRAMLSLDRLRDPQHFGPWLAGIGLNVCREWRRARPRDWWSWEALVGGTAGVEPVDRGPDPADVAEERMLAEHVRHAVAGLPRRQRAAVLLFYLRGLTHVETAAALGVEVGTVKTRLYNARAGLRRALQAEWEAHHVSEAGIAQAKTPYVTMRVVDVRRLRTEEGERRHIVLLDETGGARRLPIWIGVYEGDSLARAFERTPEARPMTYSLTASLLKAAGTAIQEVRIARLVESTYYAEIVIHAEGQTSTVDARPSDALNLALLADARIMVHTDVLEQAAIVAGDQRDQFFGPNSEGAAQIATPMGNPPAVPATKETGRANPETAEMGTATEGATPAEEGVGSEV